MHATGSIVGRVVDAKDAPLHDAQVWFRKIEGPLVNVASLSKADVDASGNFSVTGLSPGRYLVIAAAKNFAISGLYAIVGNDQKQNCRIVLRPAVQFAVKFQNEAGVPISGATLGSLLCREENGEYAIYADVLTAVGMPVEASNQDGILKLPPLSEGTVVAQGTFKHADFSNVILRNLRVAAGQIATATMRGMKVTLHVSPTADGKKISTANLRLLPFERENGSRILNQQIAFDQDGNATLVVEPGRYDVLQLQHDDYFVTPRYSSDIGLLEISPGINEKLKFELHPKAMAHGRVIDGVSGQPLQSATVSAIISNQLANFASTDADGRYELEVSVGAVPFSASFKNMMTGKSPIEAQIKPAGVTTLPDIELWPTPTIRGHVVDSLGKPVVGAIVRLRGSYFGSQDPVAATSEDGEFKFQVPRIPTDDDVGGPAWSHPLEVFHPKQPLSAHVQLHLDQPTSLSNLTIVLEPESFEDFLTRVKEPTSAWAKVREAALRKKHEIVVQESVPGQAAPELDGALWCNIDKPSMKLADCRGKYVLLCFWGLTDIPEIKLLYDTYRDNGLIVIGINDISLDVESFRERVKAQGLKFPMMLEQRDRRTSASYERIGGVRGYPAYVLVGPDGKIAETRAIGNFKFEYIRKYLFGSDQLDKPEDGRTRN